jgi:hypothetical protein
VINLNNNHLTKLPESIGDLAALRILDIIGNDFIYLPKTIEKLTNLRGLDIDNNLKYPVDISTLVNLCRSDRNKIRQINQNIRETQSVEQPELAMELATFIPKKIPNEVQRIMSQNLYGYKFPSDSNSPRKKIKKEANHNTILENSIINNASSSSSSEAKGGKRSKRKTVRTVRKTVKRKRRSTRKRRNKK